MTGSVPPRRRLSLDGTWLARLDPEDRGVAEHWHRLEDAVFDRRLLVPMPWQVADPELLQYAGVVWYRLTFNIPDDWSGGDTELNLEFGAVDYRADVWVNGVYLGGHEGGFTPFQIDATAASRKAGANTLTVRVFDPSNLDEIPHGKQGNGWYTRVSGLWQSVWLLALPIDRISRADGHPSFQAATRSGGLSVRVLTRLASARVARVSAQVVDGAGAVVAVNEGLATVSQPETRLSLRIDDAHAWEPDHPYLYELKLTMVDSASAEILDVLQQSVGLRTIEARDGHLWLNGEPLHIRGALDQAYWPRSLYTLPGDGEIEREIRLAKEMGLNLLRKHIKPEDPRYLAACDRLGMLVWAEPASTTAYSAAAREALRRDLLEMVERDFNHPSIIIWSLYNEDWGVPNLWQDRDTQAWLVQLCREVKAADPTRLVCDNSGWAHVASATDLNDYHEYFAIPERAQQLRDRLDFISQDPSDNFSAGVPSYKPPMLVSEWGNWALVDPRALSGSGETEPWWFDFSGGYQSAPAAPVLPARSSGDAIMRQVRGVEDRFHELGLDRVFGDMAALAAHAQARGFRAIKEQIEEFRRRSAIQGYVATELCDIEWECNGWLDYWRRPKKFHSQLAEVNAPLALIATPRPRNAWAGDTVELQVVVANDTAEAFDGQVAWRLNGFDVAGAVPVAVSAFSTTRAHGTILFRLPHHATAAAACVELELSDSDSQVRARTFAELASVRRDSCLTSPGLEALVRVEDRLFRQRLERSGLRRAPAPSARLIVTDRLDRSTADALASGTRVLYLAGTSTEGSELAGLRFRRLAAGESWRMSAGVAWANADRLAPAPVSAELGWETAAIFPLQLIDALCLMPDDEQLAGWFEGWLANAGAFAVLRRVGAGRLLATSFRFEHSYGVDPVASVLLHRLIELLLEGP